MSKPYGLVVFLNPSHQQNEVIGSEIIERELLSVFLAVSLYYRNRKVRGTRRLDCAACEAEEVLLAAVN